MMRVSPFVLLLVLAHPGQGAEVATNLSQGSGLTNFTNYITNDDNAIYDSATFDLVGTYGNLLQAIKDRKPGYAGMTLGQIGGLVGLTINSNPTGEVNNGWAASYDETTGKVSLEHIPGIPNLSYDVWNSSDANNDLLALTFNFVDLLDFNGNGVTDADERVEEVVLTLEGMLGGRSYVLEWNEDLEDAGGWEEAETFVMPGVSLPGVRLSEERREPLVPGGRRFYRVRWE